jgi:uncharacterized protein involved in propanediol utilization
MAAALAVAIVRSHAGEILQGAVRRADGIHRLLFSLPAPTLWTKAELIATPGQALTVNPLWARKTLSAARLLLSRLDLPQPEAMIRLTTNIPVGKGCGSSTADILATLRALLVFLRITMTEEELAKLIVEAEEASDGSILSRPAIFRHREGIVDQYLPGVLPNIHVVVIDAQPGEIVLTGPMQRARYSEDQLEAFSVLIARLNRAFRLGCASDFGAVATASARISQGFLPKPYLEDIITLVRREGGYGVGVAHSGTIVSAILPSGCSPGSLARIHGAIRELGMQIVTEFDLGCAAQLEVAA